MFHSVRLRPTLSVPSQRWADLTVVERVAAFASDFQCFVPPVGFTTSAAGSGLSTRKTLEEPNRVARLGSAGTV